MRSAQRSEMAQLGIAGRFRESRTEFYDRMWRDAARDVNAMVERLTGEFLRVRRGGVETLVNQSLVMIDSPVTVELALDKPAVRSLLDAVGLPTARSTVVRRGDVAAARAFRRTIPGPVVVKPTGTGAGNGFTGGLEGDDDLVRALVNAGRTYSSLIVEQGVTGHEYRLLYLDGVLLDAVERFAPTVRGDGSSTVAGLVLQENRRRADTGAAEVCRALRIDLDLELSVRRAGHRLPSVLRDGEEIVVKSGVSDNSARENATVRSLPDTLVADGRRAVAATRLRLAGVDVITPDPALPLSEAGGVIIEVNATPGLHHHAWVRDPESATPVGALILERLLEPASALTRRKETRFRGRGAPRPGAARGR